MNIASYKRAATPMAHDFDPGYGSEPFRSLCRDYPGPSVYPPADFRTEWGPVFHRGRLDGSARLLALGQDPAAHESIARRILIGTAGHRVQGFLSKLGLDRSYVLVNAFLYSVYGQQAGARHRKDPGIVAYRNRWLAALLAKGRIEAVVAFGSIADAAWKSWLSSPQGAGSSGLPYRSVPHPTSPESSAYSKSAVKAATKAMLKKWNEALDALAPAIVHPDAARPLVHYGDDFASGDLPPIPEADLPAGLPAWMRGEDGWAARTGSSARLKRRTVAVTMPEDAVP